MKTVKVKINKPLYGTFCNIRKKYVNRAISEGKKLEVEIPQGTAIVDPQWWKDTGKRVEQIFNYPDRPMVMYGNYVPLENVSKVYEPIPENQMKLV